MDPVEDLSHQLWTLRELLEQLVYKLEVQGLLLGAGRSRWLPFVGAELEAVMVAIHEVDAAREQARARAAGQLGLPRDATLEELAARVGEPMAQVLRSHRVHLVSLQEQVADASHSNHDLARRGLASTRELLAALGEEAVDVYDPVGATATLTRASQRLDRTV